MKEKAEDFPYNEKNWETIVAFQKLQKVYREGRSGEKEGVLGDYLRKVRQWGGEPWVHFYYALGCLALELSQRDPERSLVFERILRDFQAKAGDSEAETLFRKGLERLFGLALKPRGGVVQHRLERVRDFVQAQYQGSVRLEQVARESGFSTAALGRRFKEKFGKSFSAFLRDLRVEKAKELLIEGRLPIEQVSRESGFKNFHYFFEVFKKSTGMTPQKFRRAAPGSSDKF